MNELVEVTDVVDSGDRVWIGDLTVEGLGLLRDCVITITGGAT